MQKGGDVKAVFERFGRGLKEVRHTDTQTHTSYHTDVDRTYHIA